MGSVFCFDVEVGHALRWQIKIKSPAALLCSAAVSVGGLPVSRATIRLIDLPPADPGLTGAGDRSRLKPNRVTGAPHSA